MGYVGLTGGEIRHSEIRGDFGRGNTQPGAAGETGNPTNSEQDDD